MSQGLFETIFDDENRARFYEIIAKIATGKINELPQYIVFYGPAGCGKSTAIGFIRKVLSWACDIIILYGSPEYIPPSNVFIDEDADIDQHIAKYQNLLKDQRVLMSTNKKLTSEGVMLIEFTGNKIPFDTYKDLFNSIELIAWPMVKFAIDKSELGGDYNV